MFPNAQEFHKDVSEVTMRLMEKSEQGAMEKKQSVNEKELWKLKL